MAILSKNALTRAVNKALQETANQITEKMEIEYERAIDAFYDDYSPVMYDRTQSTYYASDHFSGAAPQANYVAGVLANVVSDNFFESKTFVNAEKSGTSYIAGITVDSGNIGYHPYKANTDWVFDRVYTEGKHGYDYEESKAWDLRWRRGMGMARPTPYVLMKRAERKLRKEIDPIFDREFSKYM